MNTTRGMRLGKMPTRVFTGSNSINIGRDFRLFTRAKIKMLVVIEDGNWLTASFGISRIIQLFKESRIGCTEFEVHVAVRSSNPAQSNTYIANPSEGDPNYTNFVFDDETLEKYDELFLFGVKSSYRKTKDEDGDIRINVSSRQAFEPTNDELTVIKQWMDNGGGVFATGDHDQLGASLCHTIPRVGTMRKWTLEDEAPPATGIGSIDTVRETNNSPGTQNDDTPQEIDWVAMRTRRLGLRVFKYPHEILCHPNLGVINVMPDHQHEGACFNECEINTGANCQVIGGDEYPTINGYQPVPKVIAYGTTTSNNDGCGSDRFAMVSVYDGRQAPNSNIGRVVVDSTWHHWMNLNINELETTGGENWEKIKRYFLNVAKWIAPKGVYKERCWWEMLTPHFGYVAAREVTRQTEVVKVGASVREWLLSLYGECGVSSIIIPIIGKVNPRLSMLYNFEEPPFLDKQIKKWPPFDDDICLSCPPYEVLETYILGHIYRALEPMADKIKTTLESDSKKAVYKISVNNIEKIALMAAKKGIKEYSTKVLREHKLVERMLNNKGKL